MLAQLANNRRMVINTISLKEIIKGKTIVVIGNAPIEEDIREAVECADVVFRFNHAYNMSEKTGERCTHLVATPCALFNEQIRESETGKKIVAQKPVLLTCKQKGERTELDVCKELFEHRVFVEESDSFEGFTTGTNFIHALSKVSKYARSIAIYGLPCNADEKKVRDYFARDARHYPAWVNEMAFAERVHCKIFNKSVPSENKFVLPIIPMRSGSTGCKDKNIKDFDGFPLCAHSINQMCRLFGLCVVLTDSNEYLQVARQYGAKAVMFELPEKNVSICLRNYCDMVDYDGVVLLRQCTSPKMVDEKFKEYQCLASEIAKDKKIVGISCVKISTKHSSLFVRERGLNADGKEEVKVAKLTNVLPTVPRQQIGDTLKFFGGATLFHSNQVRECRDIFDNAKYTLIEHEPKEALDIDSERDFYKY